MESEDVTVKVMQAGLRGGLSLAGRRYLLLERDVDICDRFEFTHDGGRFPHISRRPDLVHVFFPFLRGVPDGQALMYIGGGSEGSTGE